MSETKTINIAFLRHAETECNVLGLSQGWADGPINQLSERGREQARAAAARLLQMHPDVSRIWTADNGRSFDTGQMIVAAFAGIGRVLPISRVAGLNELQHGDLEGAPHALRLHIKRDFYLHGGSYPNGDSLLTLSERISTAVQQILNDADGHRTIAIVTSNAALKTILWRASGWTLQQLHDFALANCAIFSILYSYDPSTNGWQASKPSFL